MNEFFVEDENSFYEIDPDCQAAEQKEKRRAPRRQRREIRMSSQDRMPDCSCLLISLIVIGTVCQDRRKRPDRKR